MYNIVDQHQNQSARANESVMMLLANETKSGPVITSMSGGHKIDCAKECPCNVPVIPVPDQWLEVMVTGGFKVWHILFIIIAFLVTIVVVYCCFHRCRIPRTKQEIEADLMRTNLATKFRDYLQEFPNEPTTFVEALKKVQEMEEKWANEQDDAGARKRMGWLKLRGKERGQPDKGAVDPGGEGAGETAEQQAGEQDQQQANVGGDKPEAAASQDAAALKPAAPGEERKREFILKPLPKQSSAETKAKQASAQKEPGQKKHLADLKAAKMVHVVSDKTNATSKERQLSKTDTSQPPPEVVQPAGKAHKTKGEKVERQSTKHKGDGEPASQPTAVDIDSSAAGTSTSLNRPARARRKRDKPNLSRTKAAHVGESIEANTNILTIPVASHRRQHHHHQSKPDEQQAEQNKTKHTAAAEAAPVKRDARSGKTHSSRTRASKKDSTVIQINTDEAPS